MEKEEKIKTCCPFEVNHRVWERDKRTFRLSGYDIRSKRRIIKGIVISTKTDMKELIKAIEEDNGFSALLTDEAINQMNPKERYMYSRLKVIKEIKAVYVVFRPNTNEIYELARVFPGIKYLFMTKSSCVSLGTASIHFIKDIWKVQQEVLWIGGFRCDLCGVFNVEVYENKP